MLETLLIFSYALVLIIALFTLLKGNRDFEKTKNQIAVVDSPKSELYLLSIAIIVLTIFAAWFLFGKFLFSNFSAQSHSDYDGALSDKFYLVYFWLIPMYHRLTQKNKCLAFKKIAELKILIFWPTVFFWLYFITELIVGFLPFEDWIITSLLLAFYLTGAWFTFTSLFLKT